MASVFASHNALGRFFDESIYQADVSARLADAGLGPLRTEVPLVVSWRNYRKTYYLDLVVQDTVVYELKAANALVGEHEAQLLNYLLLLDLPHGKLVNFRPASVQHRFVSTSLSAAERRRYVVRGSLWREVCPSCASLRLTLMELLCEWGAFLTANLYEEALVSFFGGEAQVEQRVNLSRGGIRLGSQRMLLHAPSVAFKLTAATEHRQHVEAHLRRLLALTNLQALQWINLNHFEIELTTLFPEA
jgi:GxxExxY protein